MKVKFVVKVDLDPTDPISNSNIKSLVEQIAWNIEYSTHDDFIDCGLLPEQSVDRISISVDYDKD